jgi:hypothetical protein
LEERVQPEPDERIRPSSSRARPSSSRAQPDERRVQPDEKVRPSSSRAEPDERRPPQLLLDETLFLVVQQESPGSNVMKLFLSVNLKS